MQGYGLHSNSALFWPPEKGRVREPFVILSPRLASGTRENARVAWHVRPLLGPRESTSEVASSDFCPAFGVGDPREGRCDVAASDLVPFVGDPLQRTVCVAFPPLLGPREGRGEAATSDFVPAFGVGDPRECGVYVAIPPSFGPPRRQG